MTSHELTPQQRSIEALLAALEATVVGQREAAEQLAAAYLAGGHALVEGFPGIGKTLLARAFAGALGLGFKRVQFTPDLMPSDITGINVFNQESGGFRLVRGPIFTQILMADEINRTPPKTQSALLESMQERQVTIDGEGHALPATFFVVATQNPIELEGTYPLPEAQLDRFLLRIKMKLPSRASELELFRRQASGEVIHGEFGKLPDAVMLEPAAHALRGATRSVHVGEELLEYLADLAAAVRASDELELAVSPRGAMALLETARAAALIEGRDHAIPDDFKRFLEPCWAHRLILTPEAELEGHRADQILARIAASVPVPK